MKHRADWLWLAVNLAAIILALAATILEALGRINPQDVPRWILWAILAWLTSAFVESAMERFVHYKRTEELISEGQARIQCVLEERLTPQKIQFCRSQDKDYEATYELITSAPPNAYIYLTQLAPEPVLEEVGLQVRRYRDARDNRIAKNDCYFNRIVAIYNEDGLNELKRHLDRCKSSTKYELRVFKGRCLSEQDAEPHFESVVIWPSKALLGLPFRQAPTPGEPGGFYIADTELVSVIKNWFDRLWLMSKPIQTAKCIDEAFLQELGRQLQGRSRP